MKKIPRTVSIVVTCALCAALACLLAACSGSGASSSSSGSASKSTSSSSASSASSSSSSASAASYTQTASGEYAKGTHHATMTVKGFDPFVIELDADDAPVTVANFCELANSGFYNGVPMHRIVEGFCLQGGDPTATGAGGSDQEILGEFSANGVDNKLADDFQKGTVAMAQSQLPNSASSQFFITLADGDEVIPDSGATVGQALNGSYAAFGTIDKAGMKIVDKIVDKYLPKADKASGGAIADKSDMPVIESVEITD